LWFPGEAETPHQLLDPEDETEQQQERRTPDTSAFL